jgi:AAA+ ATPase superfamily predicted ATPase
MGRLMVIIGRDTERNLLNKIYLSKEAELLAVHGRRRVGKTYLIKHYFQSKQCIYFQITGIKNAKSSIQLERYTRVLSDVFYPGLSLKTPSTWMNAFEDLTQAIAKIPVTKKIVLFFDELPWLASRKSGVLQALEYFWNRYWVDDKRLKLVVCGSSSSWIIDKIIKNRAGLHNRVTRKLRLMPLNLSASKQFLAHLDVCLTQKQLLKLYMATGGIPYYLKQIEKTLSVDQNINQLFFNTDGLFFDEFEEVFASLFDNADSHKELVEIISRAQEGISRNELEKQNKSTGVGGYLTKRLNDLESAGFISSYIPFQHKRRGTFYRISDEYCYFYLKWVQPIKSQLKRENKTQYWLNVVNTPSYHSWSGYAFENICYKHINHIRSALSLPSSSLASPWRYSPTKESNGNGAQIDLLFDRPDNAITICEIKYTDKPFVTTKTYAEVLATKVEVFQKITKTQKQTFLSLISVNGIKKNKYTDSLVTQVLQLEDLFDG